MVNKKTLLGKIIFALCNVLAGCSSISGTLPATKSFTPLEKFYAGAAQVDITPFPGIPMGGYSIVGTTARGYWTRLYAKAIYLEDPLGQPLVLVSCDLWSIPAGLADRVAQLAASTNNTIAREQLIIAATHTHQSPGNYSSCGLYNRFASHKGGFDKNLFEFLAKRIAQAISSAFKNKQHAQIHSHQIQLSGVSRNRSLSAFILNPERDIILQENQNLDIVPTLDFDKNAYRAIDPTLTILRISPNGNYEHPMAIMTFFATHPTAMGPTTEIYNSDIFGVAATTVEEHFQFSDQYRPIVAMFNGAEGDISPNWDKQDRKNTVYLGKKLARGMIDCLATKGTEVTGNITYNFENIALADRQFTDAAGITRYTADEPMSGVATLGGATDGRSALHELVWREGVKGIRTKGQGVKQPAQNPLRLELPAPIAWFLNLLVGTLDAPKKFPAGIYQLGSIAFVTLPGEFTMTMGRRITHSLKKKLNKDKKILLIGLANEYISYFTTPQEYEAQNYEGSSMLYGPHAGSLVETELTRVAGNLSGGQKRTKKHKYNYSPGSHRSFSIHDVGFEPSFADSGLANVIQDLTTGYPIHNLPRFIWQDIIPRWQDIHSDKTKATPLVSLEIKTNGKWEPLYIDKVKEDDQGLNIITIALGANENQSKWCALWMVPKSFSQDSLLRFKIQTLNQNLIYSTTFKVR